MARELEIDVVVMDLSMPFVGGLEATRILHRFRPQTKVVIFTMFEDEYDRAAALEAGAAAYLIKDDAFRELAAKVFELALFLCGCQLLKMKNEEIFGQSWLSDLSGIREIIGMFPSIKDTRPKIDLLLWNNRLFFALLGHRHILEQSEAAIQSLRG